MASISIDALVVGAERLFARGVMTEDELKARKKQLDTTPHIKRDLLIIVMGLVGSITAMVACHSDKGPAAWAFAFFCMCPVTYRKMFGPALNGERSEEEASPAASSLAWSTKTSKRDDGSVALIGVPLNVDGTRGEAPQDAEEWISDGFCLCAAAYALTVTIGIVVWFLGVGLRKLRV